MSIRDNGNKSKVAGAACGFAGGILIVIGALSPWIRSEGISIGPVSIPPDIRGWDLSFGPLLCAAGLLAIALAIGAVVAKHWLAVVLGVGLVIAALAAGVIVAVHMSTVVEAYVAFAVSRAKDAGVPMDGVEASIRELVRLSSLNVERGFGSWLAAGGVILVLVGGSTILWAGSRSTSVPAHARDEKQAEIAPGHW